ncbi:unnamed protein product, partial [marine sediment metagenome]
MKKNEDFILTEEVSKITGYGTHSIRLFANEGLLKVIENRPVHRCGFT